MKKQYGKILVISIVSLLTILSFSQTASATQYTQTGTLQNVNDNGDGTVTITMHVGNPPNQQIWTRTMYATTTQITDLQTNIGRIVTLKYTWHTDGLTLDTIKVHANVSNFQQSIDILELAQLLKNIIEVKNNNNIII